jgi:hypothetical protein
MPFFVQGEKIVLKKDGTWIADGIEITHDQTREAFFKSIKWDETEQKYCLAIGYEVMFIEVEDTPYFVTALITQKQSVRARLSNFTEAPIADHLKYEGGNLYLELADGQRAKFLSAPYYDLLHSLQEDEKFYFLTIEEKRVNLSAKDSESLAGIRGAPPPTLKRK